MTTDPLVEFESREDLHIFRILIARIMETDEAYQMRQEMLDSIGDATFSTLAIDFGKVEFMGTVGFLALMGLRRTLPDHRIVVCNLSENLMRLFVACRLVNNDPSKPTVFEVADSVDDLAEA